MATFIVNDALKKNAFTPDRKSLETIVSKHETVNCVHHKTETDYDFTSVPFDNGLFGTVIEAYNLHMNLVLRPDDIWLAIVQAVSNYVNKYPEEMRQHFVHFNDKQSLTVDGDGGFYTADWNTLIPQMSKLIDKNTKNNIATWFTCNFSTTTINSRIASKVVAMAGMKKYFTYEFRFECGLPSVTLEGTKEDWLTLKENALKINEWNQPEFKKWSIVLQNVLQNFVDAFDGKVDTDFWNRIVKQKGGGSSVPTIHGWILTFAPWDNDGNFMLRSWDEIVINNNYGYMESGKIPTGYVSCPVHIDDNGNNFDVTFISGSMGAVYSKENNSIRPSIDWLIVQ